MRLWRPAHDLAGGPTSSLLARRGLPQLQLMVPAAFTNVAATETVSFLGEARIPLPCKPQPQQPQQQPTLPLPPRRAPEHTAAPLQQLAPEPKRTRLASPPPPAAGPRGIPAERCGTVHLIAPAMQHTPVQVVPMLGISTPPVALPQRLASRSGASSLCGSAASSKSSTPSVRGLHSCSSSQQQLEAAGHSNTSAAAYFAIRERAYACHQVVDMVTLSAHDAEADDSIAASAWAVLRSFGATLKRTVSP